jgi:regulation of enolase protein 1 (concanavalin A-like superfamily)
MDQQTVRWARRHGDGVPRARHSTITILALLCLASASSAYAQSLPAGWTGADINAPSLGGTASASGGVFTIEGSGSDIWDAQDQFFYVYRQVSGDVDIIALVATVENTHRWAKAGVMIRASVAAGAAHASLLVTPGMGLAFQSRPATNAWSEHVDAGTGTAPVWVKLEKRGTTITAFRSPNGTTWTMSSSRTLTVPQTFLVGLAVSSHNTAALATATFSNVTVQSPSGSAPPSVALTAPANGATFTAPATIALAATASDPDNGVSQVEFFAGTTLIGTDTTSPYNANWTSVPAGTYSLTAVARDAGGLTTTSAARTVTVSPSGQTDTTPPTVSITAPANGAIVQSTVAITAAASDNVGVASVTFRVDGTAIGSPDTTAPYSVNWNAGAASPGSHVLTAEAADTAGNRRTSASVTVTVQAPAAWVGADIGSPALSGRMSQSGGVITAEGAGYDIWRERDEFHFVHRAVTGDVDITARVTGVENTNAWAKAGVMIRGSLDANAAHAMMIVSPANGFSMQSRPAAGGGSVNLGGGSGTAPLWVKLERRGSAITAFRSTNGTTWTMSGSQTLTLPQTFYVGLAVTSHNTGALATATFDNVTVQSTSGTTPPTVALTAPTNGATFTAPATIALTATASDTDNGVSQVQFFAGTTLIGTDTASPYSASWANVPAGTYSLTAVARDAGGLTTTSAARTVTVSPSGQTDTTPPTVSITAPANGATVQNTVTITATAADNVGVASVIFRLDGAVIGSADTTAPYSASWNASAASPGSHVLTAEAADAAGNRRTSASVTVTVPMPSRAVFNPSTNHDTAVTRYQLDIFTAGADPSTATPVQTQNLGKPTVSNGECSVDIATTIQSLPGGSYIATVTAIGPGGSARSAPSAAFTR